MPLLPERNDMKSIPKGNRKLFIGCCALVCLTAITITAIAVQPEGVDLLELIGTGGGILALIKSLFVAGNLYEHKNS